MHACLCQHDGCHLTLDSTASIRQSLRSLLLQTPPTWLKLMHLRTQLPICGVRGWSNQKNRQDGKLSSLASLPPPHAAQPPAHTRPALSECSRAKRIC